MQQKTKQSVLEQLKHIGKMLHDLEIYSFEVDSDIDDAIFYSKLQDMINVKITEFE